MENYKTAFSKPISQNEFNFKDHKKALLALRRRFGLTKKQIYDYLGWEYEATKKPWLDIVESWQTKSGRA